MNVKVCVLTGFGINADQEMSVAFKRAGAQVSLVHVEDLCRGISSLDDFSILAFPGGFAFGDHLGSGKVLSHIVRKSLRPQIDSLVGRGGLVIGICNGFQTLVKMGLLPNRSGDWNQEVSLVHNDIGHFLDCWVHLRRNPDNDSPWLRGIDGMFVPIRHGEGRLVVNDEVVAKAIERDHLCAFEYRDGAPNGSFRDIAGLTDVTGRVLGLMPHPECYLQNEQRPDGVQHKHSPEGLSLFYNAVSWIREAI